MTVNKATIALITEFEGFVPNWYPDPAHGWKVPTCCYGHTDMAGEPKYADTKDKKFTKAEGAEILLRDLKKYESYVAQFISAPLNANQYGALTSFTFNLGPGNLEKSTLRKKINALDYEGASKEFSKWNKAEGKVLPGLTRRRTAEAALFMTPVNDSSPPNAPIIVAEPDYEPTKKGSALPWIIGAAIIITIVFVVTQVRF